MRRLAPVVGFDLRSREAIRSLRADRLGPKARKPTWACTNVVLVMLGYTLRANPTSSIDLALVAVHDLVPLLAHPGVDLRHRHVVRHVEAIPAHDLGQRLLP